MKFQPLKPWVMGNESISRMNFYMNEEPSKERGAFLGLDEVAELFKANLIDTGNLEDLWRANEEYIIKACEIAQYNSIQEAKQCWFELDKEEKYWILNELGEPPYSSYNIYIITIYDDLQEKVVYIWKTDSKEIRF